MNDGSNMDPTETISVQLRTLCGVCNGRGTLPCDGVEGGIQCASCQARGSNYEWVTLKKFIHLVAAAIAQQQRLVGWGMD